MIAVYVLIALVGAAFFYVLGWATCSQSMRGRVEAALESVKLAREQTKELREQVKEEGRYAEMVGRVANSFEGYAKLQTAQAAKLETVSTQMATVFNRMSGLGMLDAQPRMRPDTRQRGEHGAPPLVRETAGGDDPLDTMIR